MGQTQMRAQQMRLHKPSDSDEHKNHTENLAHSFRHFVLLRSQEHKCLSDPSTTSNARLFRNGRIVYQTGEILTIFFDSFSGLTRLLDLSKGESIIRANQSSHRQGGCDYEVLCRVLTDPVQLQLWTHAGSNSIPPRNSVDKQAAQRDLEDLSGRPDAGWLRDHRLHDFRGLSSWSVLIKKAECLRKFAGR